MKILIFILLFSLLIGSVMAVVSLTKINFEKISTKQDYDVYEDKKSVEKVYQIRPTKEVSIYQIVHELNNIKKKEIK